MNLTERARELRARIEALADSMDDAAALETPELFPRWKTDTAYIVGDRICYLDTLYKCIQAHTSQDDWTPARTPALWVVVSVEEWPEWVQPTGAQDAYNKGDRVRFEGKHYISLIDGNTWSPEAYPAGWEVQA